MIEKAIVLCFGAILVLILCLSTTCDRIDEIDKSVMTDHDRIVKLEEQVTSIIKGSHS